MHGFVSSLLENWTSFYSNHSVIRTVVGFLHLGGLVVGGGCAIAADRMTLITARRGAAERAAQLEALRGTHALVLVSLAAVTISGLLLLAADSETLLHSMIFWLKMGLVAALVANGVFLTRAERQAEADASGWRTLTIASMVSMALWILTTLAGSALPNV
jgi:hypothetical protein